MKTALAILLLLAAGDGAADFGGLTWIDAKPDLKGKVVVVRWWTNGCPFCTKSSPALNELSKKAAAVAVYHPKPPRDVTAEQVRGWAKEIGMPGALAVDRDWEVLRRWEGADKHGFTSLTFLLDKKGRIRHVHPGGEVTADEGKELSRKIDALLAEE